MLSVRTLTDARRRGHLTGDRRIGRNRWCFMNGRHSSILVAVSLAASAPVLADDIKSPAVTPRELAHCMMKRLRANTSESYHGAFKACREQFDATRSDRPTDTAMNAAKQPENPKQ